MKTFALLLPKSNRIACLVAVATSLGLAPGCKGNGQVLGTIGVPTVEFGGEGIGAQVKSNIKNPCEIDLDFGNLPIGETETATVKIVNSGAGQLDLSEINPTLDPEYALVLPSLSSAGPGEALPISVTFQPYQTNPANSSFTIPTDGVNSTCQTPNTITVVLTGTGIKLNLLVQPAAIDFGNTIVGTTEKRSVTLINNSGGTINNITSIVTGGDSNFFTILDAPTSLLPNGQGTVDISFAPLAVETRSLASVIFEGADGERTTLGLFGEPLNTALTVPTTPINFGYVQLGDTVIGCTTVTNSANVSVDIKGLTSFATQGSTFALAPTDDATPPNPFSLPLTLKSGTSAKVCFSFTPPITQQFLGQATLVTDDPSGIDPIVKLTGWGGGPQITCTPATVGFGQTLLQSVSSLPVVCTNTGTVIPGVKLLISPPKASPFAFTGEFDTTNSYPVGGLAPGEDVQINVNFAPTKAGTESGTLFIGTNGGQGKTVQIPLTGQGLNVPACQYVLSPTSLDFANVAAGDTSQPLSFEIQNTGSNVCLVQGVTIKNDTTGSFHILTTSIPPDPQTGKISIPAPAPGVDSNLTVSLTFQPSAAGASFVAEAAFSISDPSDPNQVLRLTGTSELGCLVVTPSSLNFGDVGQSPSGGLCTSSIRTFTVFNQCQTNETLQLISVQSGPGDTLQQFSTPDGPEVPGLLAAGSPEVFETAFEPLSLGAHTAQILVSDGTLETMLPVQGTAVAASTTTDTFVIEKPKADILWILDDDDYGVDEQSAVQSQFQGFIAAGAGIDFRMAVTTDNDGLPNETSTAEFGRLLPCAGCSVTGTAPTIISPSTPNPATALANLWGGVDTSIYVGLDYQFFIALYNALQVGPQPGVDFFRPGAYFASITDSEEDEPDESNTGAGGHNPSFFLSFFQGYFPNPALFSWNFILPSRQSNGTGFAPSAPPNIAQMAAATGGVVLNSEDSAWGAALNTIWNPVVAAGAYHALSGSPSRGQSGITVTVDGVAIDQQDGVGNVNWTYQQTINAIVFNLNNNPPAVGATVQVTYPIDCN